MLTVRNRFRRRWLNEDIPDVDYFAMDDVSDRRMSTAARTYNVREERTDRLTHNDVHAVLTSISGLDDVTHETPFAIYKLGL